MDIAWPVKTREMHNQHIDSTVWNDFRFRDDDIVISTYAKCGTTWMQQIVAQTLYGPDPELAVAEMSPWLDLTAQPIEEVVAQGAAIRLQLLPAQRRSLILLVDHHLTLSNMAQQRNLDDPETAVEFALIVKDQKNLDALMLLTLADGQGTSADAWSDWKELLVWH